MNLTNNVGSSSNQEFDEVFCAYGKAVYESSGIERSIIQMFVIDTFDPSDPKIVETAFRTIEQKKPTLGSLIRDAGTKLNLPAKIRNQLDSVLKDRNWLIHHFYFDAYPNIINRESRKELIKSLESLTQRFGNLNDLIIKEIIRRMVDKGISQDILDQLAKDVTAEIEG